MARLPDGLVRRAVPYSRALGAGTVVLLFGWLLFVPDRVDDRRQPAVQACRSRVPVKVISSTEKIAVLDRLAEGYNSAARPAGATCARITLQGVSSGLAEEALAGNPDQDPAVGAAELAAVADAQVWSPTDSLWLDRLALDTKGRIDLDRDASLARSVLVLAMPATLAERLGWRGDPPTWHQAMTVLRRGQARYSQENPRTSTSGTLATYLTFLAARVDAGDHGGLESMTLDEVRTKRMNRFVHDVQGAAAGGFTNDSTDILRTWATSGPDVKAMALLQEQMVWGYDTGQYGGSSGERVPLIAIHPRGRSGGSESVMTDHPYAVLPSATEAQRRAARDFLQYLQENQKQLCAAGFHDPAGGPPVACAGTAGQHVPAGLPKEVGRTDLGRDVTSIRLPGVEVQRELVLQWLAMRPVRRIVILMDVSGSMRADRLRKAREAVKQGVRSLRPQDWFEVVQFAGSARGTGPYRVVVPLTEVGNAADRERNLAGLDGAAKVATERTALLTSVDRTFRRLAALPRSTDRRSLDAMIVLSDGINEWGTGHPNASAVCGGWDSVRPNVPVYSVHYTPDRADGYDAEQIRAGAAELRKLSTCAEPRGAVFSSDQDSALASVFRTIMGDL